MTITYGDLRAHIAGVTEKQEESSVRICLPKNTVIRVDPTKGDRAIHCWSGTLWVTRAGDHEDYVLAAGECIRLPRSGRVVVEALDEAVIGLCQ